MRELPFIHKGTPTYPCPWPDEPLYIEYAPASFAINEGGALTRSLVERCEQKPRFGQRVYSVRCTWLDAREHQHIRDDWHTDDSHDAWLYIDGVAPTEIKMFGGRVYTVPLRTLFPYQDTLHRSPPTNVPGWRYFFRMLDIDEREVQPRSKPLPLSLS